MSCGDHHDTDCGEVRDRLYAYIDAEVSGSDPVDVEAIRHHLEECAPCLREHDVEVLVKKVVRRACAGDCAPADLRLRILTSITTVRVG